MEDIDDVELLEYTDDDSGITHRIGNLKSEYDWGLYNGSRGSNPDNLNATGLYTYEGKELQGQWRTMRLEEVFYLLGIPALDNDINRTFSQFDITDLELSRILKDGASGGYCLLYRAAPFGGYSTPTIVDFPAFYYDYSTNQWAPYKFLVESQINGDEVYSGGVKATNISEDNYQVLNSYRYDSEGNPQCAEVIIIDQETMEKIPGLAILPDNDDWDDPCKNESSADGKIVKGRTNSVNIENIYTKERWKFFMEPSGAVFIKGISLGELQVSWLAPLSFHNESISNYFYRYNMEFYPVGKSVKGKTIPFYVPNPSFYNSSSPTRLVQDAP